MRGSTSSTGSKASTIVNACIRRSVIKHPSMQNSVVAMWRDLVHVQSRQGHASRIVWEMITVFFQRYWELRRSRDALDVQKQITWELAQHLALFGPAMKHAS